MTLSKRMTSLCITFGCGEPVFIHFMHLPHRLQFTKPLFGLHQKQKLLSMESLNHKLRW